MFEAGSRSPDGAEPFNIVCLARRYGAVEPQDMQNINARWLAMVVEWVASRIAGHAAVLANPGVVRASLPEILDMALP